jgi:hypothetical protein
METALQEAIENAKTAKENDKNKDYVTYDEVIEMLTELLPKEREQIIGAHKNGEITMYGHPRLNKTPTAKWAKQIEKESQEYYEINFNK